MSKSTQNDEDECQKKPHEKLVTNHSEIEENPEQISTHDKNKSECETACPECSIVVPTTLHRHLANADSTNYKIYACNLCDLYFLSQCALQVCIDIFFVAKK